MTQVKINDAALQKAALEGMDEFVKVFIDATLEAIGGQLTAQNMAELNSDQITLLAWHFLHEEMMDGGMIQLIHNGFGGFIFRNPTDKAFRNWGIPDLGKGLRSQTGTLYGTVAKGTRYLELTEGYITKQFLDKDSQVCGYEYVHLGKMMEAIKNGMDANEAVKKFTGSYGRTTAEQGVVKAIDPRKE